MSMELRVFDKAIEPLGAIDELASLIWRMKYFPLNYASWTIGSENFIPESG